MGNDEASQTASTTKLSRGGRAVSCELTRNQRGGRWLLQGLG
jgi:hypothetical protein